MLVTRSSCSSVFDTEMATFTFKEQRVIIRFLHLRGMKPIEIHRQLRETCSDGVMEAKNVRSWVRQFKEGRTSCENKKQEPRPRTSRSEDMIARVEQVVMEDRRLTVRQIAANTGSCPNCFEWLAKFQGLLILNKLGDLRTSTHHVYQPNGLRPVHMSKNKEIYYYKQAQLQSQLTVHTT